jgi:hypothetical protein
MYIRLSDSQYFAGHMRHHFLNLMYLMDDSGYAIGRQVLDCRIEYLLAER